ncbi:TPA: Gfo/Idh/MocA family oxidoreductase [Pseudomonas putida]|uniref:Gfo/Idh/MocA family protein n=1 Tax=Pseudomonas TaxID=286 RepID=UPI00110CAB9C|nr:MULTISPECIES: Gfo/Idh/MocA family oxidoreductase [Pseudomonas]MDD1995069.1 Gfo/Idh/MocA family oxidoreductase [Pseudomonas putida]HDS0919414.1 Gfo/Idh/MocA family oxidoreductase [Pseudomonas putida]HDS0933802.1 Gfo/Idh/MocA family oxidoreductase [Pseudomonas putida]HDS1783914.1 Gfo/Idh/MocA family oxidoreductase [Pseudomonas putida]HDS3799716.1 Gfo/Idh/MocA family oxidoreductase [Pseudomonas putida]
MTIKLGIIGMGVISHYYLKALQHSTECELRAVCDTSQERLAPFAASSVACHEDYAALLEDPQVDAVIINLPNHLHFDACKAALRAGKHVCCEKPLTLDLEQALQLRDMARRYQLTLLTAFHRRYNRHLLRALEQGRFEGARRVTARYHERIEEHAGRDTWYLDSASCGGGCIADNGPNVYDTLSFALGTLQVQGAQVRRNSMGIDMGAQISLAGPGGLAVSAELSWDYPFGELKDLLIEYADGSQIIIDMLEGSEGFKTSLYHEYEGVLAHLASSIRGNAEDGSIGIDAVRLVRDTYALEAGDGR